MSKTSIHMTSVELQINLNDKCPGGSVGGKEVPEEFENVSENLETVLVEQTK